MKLTEEQIEPLVQLLAEYHEQSGAKGSYSARKVRLFLEREIDNPKTLLLVNKDVTAMIAYTIAPNPFSNQQNLQCICFYSQKPGAGFRLLKEAEKWIDAWGDCFAYKLFLTTGTTEKAEKMLERYGMTKLGMVYELPERNK